jgi:hypothetical protein
MPSFFEGLKRVISGQPVFRPGEEADGVTYKAEQPPEVEQQPQNQPVDEEAVEQQGPKVIPEVYIERVEHRNNGANMEVSVQVTNRSQQEVMVDKLLLLGQTRAINYVLRPGESRELPVYSGPKPNHRNYTNCELQYRDQATGDYFSSLHLVEYEAQNTEGTYEIRNIRFTPPIKDI